MTFGFFDGTLEELKASQDDHDFEAHRDAVAPFVEEVLAQRRLRRRRDADPLSLTAHSTIACMRMPGAWIEHTNV